MSPLPDGSTLLLFTDGLFERRGMLLGDGRDLLGFETLTLVPIDARLIEPGMLSRAEIAWLDAYHARVAAEIGPLVPAEARNWLAAATSPLGAAV